MICQELLVHSAYAGGWRLNCQLGVLSPVNGAIEVPRALSPGSEVFQPKGSELGAVTWNVSMGNDSFHWRQEGFLTCWDLSFWRLFSCKVCCAMYVSQAGAHQWKRCCFVKDQGWANWIFTLVRMLLKRLTCPWKWLPKPLHFGM